MTGTVANRRELGRPASSRREGQRHDTRDDLGWIATTAASVFLTMAVFLMSNSAPIEPLFFAMALPIGVGALIMSPRQQLARLVIDLPVLAIAVLMTLSVAWSLSPTQAIFEVRRDVTLIVLTSIIASLLPTRDVIQAVLRACYLSIAITIVALLFLAEARSHVPDGTSAYSAEYPGWHGLFIHKNTMSPFLVFAGVTVWLFEDRIWLRNSLMGIITILLIGSQSATGVSAWMLVVATFVWFRMYRRADGRNGTAFIVASIAVAICALMGAILSVSAITSAYGKDLTFSGRTDIWAAVLNAAADRPWFGYGLGGVFWEANTVTRQIWAEVGFVIPHAHSGWLDVLLTIGLVGVLVYAVKFATTIGLGIKVLRTNRVLGEWLLIVTAVQLLMGLSETVFTGDWIIYAAVMRAVARRAALDTEQEERQARQVDSSSRTATRLRPAASSEQ